MCSKFTELSFEEVLCVTGGYSLGWLIIAGISSFPVTGPVFPFYRFFK